LYLLNVKVGKDMAHIANSLEESAMLWHERLGHLNMASLEELNAMVIQNEVIHIDHNEKLHISHLCNVGSASLFINSMLLRNASNF
jgi:hypothetical protein